MTNKSNTPDIFNESDELIKITKKKLLLVEGQDEKNFFEALIKKKNISAVQVNSLGGKNNFKKDNLSTLMKDKGFNKLQSIAIIQDADKNCNDRFKSISGTIKQVNKENQKKLPIPKKLAEFTNGTPKLGVFLIPNNKSSGMLEDLFLSIKKETTDGKSIIKCVDEFMDCINKTGQYKKIKNKKKAHCHAFLSTMKEETRDLGVAAKKGYWDWDSKKLDPLITFLNQL